MGFFSHPQMANDSKIVKVLRDGNLFPEYVEHGDYNLVVRGIFKTILFVVSLATLGSMTFASMVEMDLPDLRRTKDNDVRLAETKPSVNAATQVPFNNWEQVNDDVNADPMKSNLICSCKNPQIKTKSVQTPEAQERGYFSLVDACPNSEAKGSGVLQFSLIHGYPISYAPHLQRKVRSSSYVRMVDYELNVTANNFNYRPGSPVSETLPEVTSPAGNWGTFNCVKYRYMCGSANYYNIKGIDFGDTDAKRRDKATGHPNYGAQMGTCVSCCQSKEHFNKHCTGSDGETLLYEPTLYNLNGDGNMADFDRTGADITPDTPIAPKASASAGKCWGARQVLGVTKQFEFQCNKPYFVAGTKTARNEMGAECVDCCSGTAADFDANGCKTPGNDYATCCGPTPKRTYENVCKSYIYSPPRRNHTVKMTAGDLFYQRYSTVAEHVTEGRSELPPMTDAEFEAVNGVTFDNADWSMKDFITEKEFEAGITFETRNISIVKLCDAAEELVRSNKEAYLERVLSSPILMDNMTVAKVLQSRFEHMRSLSLSTFNLAFEQDTFRLEFEGVVSGWGKGLDAYLDGIHSQQIMAELDAFHGWLTQELLDLLDSSLFADVQVEPVWQDQGRKYYQMGVWYPGTVSQKKKSETQKFDVGSGKFKLNSGTGQYDIYDRDFWAPSAEVKITGTPGAQWGADDQNEYWPDCSGFNLYDTGYVPGYNESGRKGNGKKCHSCCQSYEYFQDHCADTSQYPLDSPMGSLGVMTPEKGGLGLGLATAPKCAATTEVWRAPTSIDSTPTRQGFPAKWRPLVEATDAVGDRPGGWNFNPNLKNFNSNIPGKCQWAGSPKFDTKSWKANHPSKPNVRFPMCGPFNMMPGGYADAGSQYMVTPTDCPLVGSGSGSGSGIDCCKDEATYDQHCKTGLGGKAFKTCCDTVYWTEEAQKDYPGTIMDVEDNLRLYGFQPPRYFDQLCKKRDPDSLWTGNYPEKPVRAPPLGSQISLFTRTVHRYQAYCARHKLRSMPLYDKDAGVYPPPAFTEEHMKAWSQRLFDDWLEGNIHLPLTDSHEVLYEGGEDFGVGAQVGGDR